MTWIAESFDKEYLSEFEEFIKAVCKDQRLRWETPGISLGILSKLTSLTLYTLPASQRNIFMYYDSNDKENIILFYDALLQRLEKFK